jgi:23S rRNA (adenine2030-N6)-methyltransferase
MFSYRHAFHAGNHADVLKHTVLALIANYMTQKEKPVMYIDTHSGAGLYELGSGHAAKSGEAALGIDRIWSNTDLPAPLQQLVDVLLQFNPSGQLDLYPGSPWIASKLLRAEDQLRLFELHPSDVVLLTKNVDAMLAEHTGQKTRVMMQASNGFAALRALLPPPSRRALVLIDPPYEDKADYQHVVTAVSEGLERFPAGVYAIWYPILARMESRDLPKKLSRLPAKNWLQVTFDIGEPEFGEMKLSASGMLILNPPFTLKAELEALMPYLVKVLARSNSAKFSISEGTSTTPLRTPPRVPLRNRFTASKPPFHTNKASKKTPT